MLTFDEGVPGSVFLWVRADWRRRWRAVAALTVLAGAAGGLVLAATAGARRTATSLERLAEETSSADAVIDIGPYVPGLVDEVRDLQAVDVASAATIVFAVVDHVEVDIGILIPRDAGVGVDVEREVVVRGRLPAPARPDEVALNETTARLTGSDVGDHLTVQTLSPEQVAAEEYFSARGPELDLRVVGVTRGLTDLLGREEGTILASPALYETVRGKVDEFTTYLAVRVRPPATVADIEDALPSILGSDRPFDLLSHQVRSKPARSTISVLASGLAAFAAAAGLASLVVVGLALVRHVADARIDLDTLRALGMTRPEREQVLAATVLPVAVIGPVLAALLAAAASSLTPIGLAARAEPDPGTRLDLPVVLLGGLAVGAVVAGTSVLAAAWSTRPLSGRLRRPSSTACLAARSGAGPAVVNGVSLALDRRSPALPIFSAIGGVAAAVVVAVGVLTFSSSLDRLVDSPSRWGYGWDVSMSFTSRSIVMADALDAEEELTAIARWDAGATTIEGRSVRAHGLTRIRGEIGFSLRDGRQPAGPTEVVIGPVTADRHHVGIGDALAVVKPGKTGVATPMTIVGIGLFPEIDDGDLADGIGLVGSAFEERAIVRDLFEASQIVVRIAPDADLAEVIDRLQERVPDAHFDQQPVPPSDVASLSSIRSMPRWLLVLVAVLGIASLTHVLRSTSARRRSVLAILRAIGMTRSQIRSCFVTQAFTLAAIAVVIGVPFGLVAGRLTWQAVAGSLDVATDPDVPHAAILLVGAVAAAVAGVAGVAGAATARRHRTTAARLIGGERASGI